MLVDLLGEAHELGRSYGRKQQQSCEDSEYLGHECKCRFLYLCECLNQRDEDTDQGCRPNGWPRTHDDGPDGILHELESVRFVPGSVIL